MPTRIHLLLADGCSAASVAACLEGFECANTLHSLNQGSMAPLFEVKTIAENDQAVQCTGGMSVKPALRLKDAPLPDLVIIPGFMFHILPLLPRLQNVYEWLRTSYAQGAHIAAMCTGAFILAESGLLEARQATTHWAFAEAFTKRYPGVNLLSDRVVTDDEHIQCSGGATAGNDLLLHLLRKYGTAELANECAKKLLVDTRARSQSPYMSMQRPRHHEDEVVHRIQDWLEEQAYQQVSLEQLAGEHGLSLRQFMRRFKQATGQTPGAYLQSLRIERAKYLLESSNTTIDSITYKVGYEDGNSFRRLFRERVGVTPSAYRKKFRL